MHRHACTYGENYRVHVGGIDKVLLLLSAHHITWDVRRAMQQTRLSPPLSSETRLLSFVEDPTYISALLKVATFQTYMQTH